MKNKIILGSGIVLTILGSVGIYFGGGDAGLATEIVAGVFTLVGIIVAAITNVRDK